MHLGWNEGKTEGPEPLRNTNVWPDQGIVLENYLVPNKVWSNLHIVDKLGLLFLNLYLRQDLNISNFLAGDQSLLEKLRSKWLAQRLESDKTPPHLLGSRLSLRSWPWSRKHPLGARPFHNLQHWGKRAGGGSPGFLQKPEVACSGTTSPTSGEKCRYCPKDWWHLQQRV